ncbi:MAG: hypothetical protein LBC17_03150 [Lactobacillaceae bacterium]|jgi:hypothetical protein|nr:hypothetical protein [Lactobacillaceae bacterium]
MEKIYLTFGTNKILNSIINENTSSEIIPISKNGEQQLGIMSSIKLSGTDNSIEFDIVNKYQVTQYDRKPIAFMFTYLTGENKIAKITDKTLQTLSKNDFVKDNAVELIFAKEHKDLKRYVLITSWDNINDLQHFKNSKLIDSIVSNYYSHFNIIYTRGLD